MDCISVKERLTPDCLEDLTDFVWRHQVHLHAPLSSCSNRCWGQFDQRIVLLRGLTPHFGRQSPEGE